LTAISPEVLVKPITSVEYRNLERLTRELYNEPRLSSYMCNQIVADPTLFRHMINNGPIRFCSDLRSLVGDVPDHQSISSKISEDTEGLMILYILLYELFMIVSLFASFPERFGSTAGHVAGILTKPFEIIGDASDSVGLTDSSEKKRLKKSIEDLRKYKTYLQPFFPQVNFDAKVEELTVALKSL
jgi:hypothetical protein